MIRCIQKSVPISLVLALSVALGVPLPAEAIEGRWLTGKRKVAVTLFSCGDAYCGRIDWLAKPNRKDGSLKIDSENPDPSLRDRPYCGIEIITALRPDGPGVWTGGNLYNPQDGRTYDIEIKTDGNGLDVRAYLGIRLLGKSEDWIPAPEDTPGC